MAFTSASVRITLRALLTGNFGPIEPTLQKPDNSAIQAGVTDGKADLVYAAERTIVNAGTPDVLDLIGGGLLTPEGSAFNPVEVITIGIVNNSALQVLTVGAGSNPLVGYLGGTTPTKTVGKSGMFLDHNPLTGYPVTAGTADKLQVAVDGGSNITYLVFLLARSA